MQTQSLEGFKYAQSFTDDYSGTMMVYFLKSKCDTVQATEKFLADIAPYGEIKCIWSDDGTEFTSKSFKELMIKNKIRHETSAPYSPHQNGTAERGWRTLGDMSRCLLIESELPEYLWNYAMQLAAYIRNRCYNRRTPYEMFTGREPNVSKLQKFGSECFAYKQEKGKLESRCNQGIFVGYDKNSPAYLVYYPETEKVQKHRLVKFSSKAARERCTQTESNAEVDNSVLIPVEVSEVRNTGRDINYENDSSIQDAGTGTLPEQTDDNQPGQVTRRYPRRDRMKPARFQEFEMEDTEE